MTDTSGSKIPDLCAFIYHSRAVTPFKTSELIDLVKAAQARNKRLRITGILGYDEGQFFQLIEGPVWSMDAVVASIMRDPRHTNIQIAFQGLVPMRMYGDWDLRLCRREGTIKWQQPSDHVEAATRCALMGDVSAVKDVVRRALEIGLSANSVVRTVIEPAARQLGDAWRRDDCYEIDMALGLFALRTATLQLNQAEIAPALHSGAFSALVTAQPGERRDILGVGITADALARAGWTVNVCYPSEEAELTDLIRCVRPNVIDIALSEALPYCDDLEGVRRLVRSCRAAISDDQTLISVGGRLFSEQVATARSVHADIARTSAATIAAEAKWLLEHRLEAKWL